MVSNSPISASPDHYLPGIASRLTGHSRRSYQHLGTIQEGPIACHPEKHPFCPPGDRIGNRLHALQVATESLPRRDGCGRLKQRFMNRVRLHARAHGVTPLYNLHIQLSQIDAVSSGPTLCLEQCFGMRTGDALHENRCGNRVGAFSDR